MTPDRMVTVSADRREVIARAVWDFEPPFDGSGLDKADEGTRDHYLCLADAVLAALASVPEEHPEQGPTDSAFDLAKPMHIRAEMARAGIAPMQNRPWDDPERGYVDPLNDDETRTTLRRFLAALWGGRANEPKPVPEEPSDG